MRAHVYMHTHMHPLPPTHTRSLITTTDLEARVTDTSGVAKADALVAEGHGKAVEGSHPTTAVLAHGASTVATVVAAGVH